MNIFKRNEVSGSEESFAPSVKKPPLLIYQMGKVGSSSVYHTLNNADIPYTIAHIHMLSDSGIEVKERWLRYNKIDEVPRDLKFFKGVRRQFDDRFSEFEWKVITMTREPLGLEISGIFENMKAFFSDLLNNKQKPDFKKSSDFLKDRFVNADLTKNYYHNWFDREIKELFDINVYDYKYGFDKGYSIIKKNNISILLIRMEDLNRSFHLGIDDFLGLGKINLINENTASNKYYSDQYKSILEKFSLPVDVCEKIYSTEYAQHFYTPEERKKLIQKWTGL